MDEDKAYWSEDQWRKNNWRCGHGWLRGEQCEICNAPKREWQGLTDEDVNRESAPIASQMKLAFHAGMYVAQQVLKERNT
jgi:hypothetical protein